MRTPSESLRPGELVELRPPGEIARVLDRDGATERLPFMPEMLDFFGQRLRVARRALTVCYSGPGLSRGFHSENVVTLDGVRCSGESHDGCSKACMVFWHEAWLKRADEASEPPEVDRSAVEALRSRLKITTDAATFYCQASELPRTTHTLTRVARMKLYLRGLKAGNISLPEAAAFLVSWMRTKMWGAHPRGTGELKTLEKLDLQPGEWVEVKPMSSILQTLDENGLNKGLWFSPDMVRWCGRRLRVKRRLEKIIVDGTGQVRKLRNTVILEGSRCGCTHLGLAMAGCSRCEYAYWREIWLRRCEAPGAGELFTSTRRRRRASPAASPSGPDCSRP